MGAAVTKEVTATLGAATIAGPTGALASLTYTRDANSRVVSAAPTVLAGVGPPVASAHGGIGAMRPCLRRSSYVRCGHQSARGA